MTFGNSKSVSQLVSICCLSCAVPPRFTFFFSLFFSEIFDFLGKRQVHHHHSHQHCHPLVDVELMPPMMMMVVAVVMVVVMVMMMSVSQSVHSLRLLLCSLHIPQCVNPIALNAPAAAATAVSSIYVLGLS